MRRRGETAVAQTWVYYKSTTAQMVNAAAAKYAPSRRSRMGSPNRLGSWRITDAGFRRHTDPRPTETAVARHRQRIEVIVVVDRPDPETISAVRAVNDPRLQLIVNPQPSTAAGARNAGADHARGEWIAFPDDNDEWLPSKLERQIAFSSGRPPALLSCLSRVVTPTATYAWPQVIFDSSGPIDEYLFDRRSLLGGWGFIQTSSYLLPAGCLIMYGSTSRALMTIGSSHCACRNGRKRASTPFRKCWSFFISRRSGCPLRPGRRHGRLLSDGSRAYDRSSPGVPIAVSVWVSSALGRPGKEPTRRFPNCSTAHFGTALPNGGCCEVCYTVGWVRAPPEQAACVGDCTDNRPIKQKLRWESSVEFKEMNNELAR